MNVYILIITRKFCHFYRIFNQKYLICALIYHENSTFFAFYNNSVILKENACDILFFC